MRVAQSIIYKGNQRMEAMQLLPRADAIKDARDMAQMIAMDERSAGRTPKVEEITGAWPVIAAFKIDTDAGRFIVRVRDQGRI